MIFTGQDNEPVLHQFDKLISELLRGSVTRNTFRRWEIDILLDIDACNLSNARRETIRRYQKAVNRAMAKGAQMPFKLSEYLNLQNSGCSVARVLPNQPSQTDSIFFSSSVAEGTAS